MNFVQNMYEYECLSYAKIKYNDKKRIKTEATVRALFARAINCN